MLLVGAYEAASRPAYTYTVRPLALPGIPPLASYLCSLCEPLHLAVLTVFREGSCLRCQRAFIPLQKSSCSCCSVSLLFCTEVQILPVWQGMLAKVIGCVGTSAAIFLGYTLVLVVRTQPWWQVRLRSAVPR